MKYLITILLLIFFQGCMVMGEHGKHGKTGHNTAEDRPAHRH